MSGHIFFADRFYGFDDATYAGARVLEILSKTDRTLSRTARRSATNLFDAGAPRRLPGRDEIRRRRKDRGRILQRSNEVITIDGARIIFDHGWGLVRASNTQAILVLRFEADSKEHLDRIRSIVETKVARTDRCRLKHLSRCELRVDAVSGGFTGRGSFITQCGVHMFRKISSSVHFGFVIFGSS